MNKFTKPPLTNIEKQKKTDEFLNYFDSQPNVSTDNKNKLDLVNIKKEITVASTLRLPQSLFKDLNTISALTGLTRNAICIELLRVSIKNKLKDLLDN